VERREVEISWPTPRSAFICPSFFGAKVLEGKKNGLARAGFYIQETRVLMLRRLTLTTRNGALPTGGSQAWASWPLVVHSARTATRVDSGLNVTIPQPLEVNHGGGDITVAHPLLERANVDSILEMPCGIGVTEFM